MGHVGETHLCPDSFVRNGSVSSAADFIGGGTKAATQLGEVRCELSLRRMYITAERLISDQRETV